MADNPYGAPTEGLGQTPTFRFRAAQPGQREGQDYRPTAPARSIPRASVNEQQMARPDYAVNPLLQALVKVADGVAAGGLQQARTNALLKGQQAAMEGRTAAELEKDRGVLDQLFGYGDAVQGARVYGAASTSQSALGLLDESVVADAELSPQAYRDKVAGVLKAVNSGDAQEDALTRDAIIKGMPARFSKHLSMHNKFNQAAAVAAQGAAMQGALSTLQAQIRTASGELELTAEDGARLHAGVQQAMQILQRAPGQPPEVHAKVLADRLKHAAQNSELHAVNGLIKAGVLQQLPADVAEQVQADVDKAQNKALDRFKLDKRWDLAKLYAFNPRDKVSTGDRLRALEALDAEFKRTTGSEKGLFTAEQFKDLASSSESKILAALEHDQRIRAQNAIAAETHADRVQRHNERVQDASRAAAEKQQKAQAAQALTEYAAAHPGNLQATLEVSHSRGVGLSKADVTARYAAEVERLRKEAPEELDNFIRVANLGDGYVDAKEAGRLQRVPVQLMSNQDFAKDRDNANVVQASVAEYTALVNRLGPETAAAYYGRTAGFMRDLAESVGNKTHPMFAVQVARAAQEHRATPAVKEADVSATAKALEKSDGFSWFNIGETTPAMRAADARRVAEWALANPAAQGVEDKPKFVRDALRVQDLRDTATLRMEQVGGSVFETPPGVPSVRMTLKDAGVAEDRIDDFFSDAVNGALEKLRPWDGVWSRARAQNVQVQVAGTRNGAPLVAVTAVVDGRHIVYAEVPIGAVVDRGEEWAALQQRKAATARDGTLSRAEKAAINREINPRIHRLETQ